MAPRTGTENSPDTPKPVRDTVRAGFRVLSRVPFGSAPWAVWSSSYRTLMMMEGLGRGLPVRMLSFTAAMNPGRVSTKLVARSRSLADTRKVFTRGRVPTKFRFLVEKGGNRQQNPSQTGKSWN
jgi:hypothetical protein